MSFRIHASGSRFFVRSRDGLDFGDAYDMGSAIERVQSLGDSPADIIGGELAGQVEGQSNHQRLTELMGRLIGTELLVTMVTLTVVQFGSFHFTLNARQENMLWADDSATWSGWIGEPNAEERARGEPGAAQYFLEVITPVLRDADMQNFGVLAAIARMLSDWMSSGERFPNGEARLLIQVSH